jgi:hypothetical protein
MAERFQGPVSIQTAAGRSAIVLDSDNASIAVQRFAAGSPAAAPLVVRRTVIDENLVHVGQQGQAVAPESGGPAAARLMIGDRGMAGIVQVRDGTVAVLTVDGVERRTTCLTVLSVVDGNGNEVFRFDPRFANLRIGGRGGNEGDIQVLNGQGEVVIHLDGKSGDIELLGADCAELFEAADPSALPPGSVAVIGASGVLEPCRDGYDSRVAGVVAGAGDVRPGIVLGHRPGAHGTWVPLSLTGRAWCKVDADVAPIRPGDLLTTSRTVGHAMRADDCSRRPGALVGKALAALPHGCGVVPILIGLQ